MRPHQTPSKKTQDTSRSFQEAYSAFFLCWNTRNYGPDKSNQTHQALSPYGTSLDCPGLDRRGHKLAMTHQRPALGHQRGAKEGPGHLGDFARLETGVVISSEGGKSSHGLEDSLFFLYKKSA